MRNLNRKSSIALGLATVLIAGGCGQTETGQLTAGTCIRVDSLDFTFGGDVEGADCSEISFLNDVYRVANVGTEAEVEGSCGFGDLVIVDGDDAACLTK